MAIKFKGDTSVAVINSIKKAEVDTVYRCFDSGVLLSNEVINHGDFVSWDGTKWIKRSDLSYLINNAEHPIEQQIENIVAVIPEGTTEENPLVNETGLCEVAERVTAAEGDIDSIEEKIPSGASSSNKLVTESDLEAAQDSWQSGFTPKGEATVSQIDALTTQSNGDQYIVTDSGTITAGSVAVVAGDTVAWDSDNNVWYKVNQYATKTYAQNVAHSIATEFDPTRNSEHAYPAGYSVTYTDGKVYTFKKPHYGAWSSGDVTELPMSNVVDSIGQQVQNLDKAFSYITTDLEQGGFNTTTGAKQAGNNIVRNKNIIAIEALVEVNLKVSGTYLIYVYSYDANGDYIDRNALSFNSGSSDAFVYTGQQIKLLQNASYVNFAIYKADLSNFTPSSLISSGNFELSISNASKFNEVSETASQALGLAQSVNDELDDCFNFESKSFEQGGFNSSTGAKAAGNNIVRNASMIPIAELESIELKVSSAYIVYAYSYGSDGSFIARNGLSIVSGSSTAFKFTREQIKALQNGSYVNFAVYKANMSNFTPASLIASGDIVLTLSTMDTVSRRNQNTNSEFSKLLSVVGKTGMATWVDDDGDVTKIEQNIIPTANSVGVPVTFAILGNDLDNSVTVGGVTMTKAEYFQTLQEQGHHVTSHPSHTYWYGANYDITKVNPSLIKCLTTLQKHGFQHSDMLVYPGDSVSNSAVVEIVRKWCECGVRAGYNPPNHLGDSGRFKIARTFVDFEGYYTLHHNDDGFVSSMAWYKSMVDLAAANGDWVVFGSHSYAFTNSDDTSDPNANTRGNIQELMQYAVTKGLEFRTLWDAYNRRKFLYYFKEMNA